MAGVRGRTGRTRVKGRLSSFKFTLQILSFLSSLPRNTKTKFIEQLIEASSQYQSWQKTRG